MWKREENASQVSSVQATNIVSQGEGVPRKEVRLPNREVVNIGKSVLIKGEVTGSEDLTIEGRVEGKVELKQHILTIGSHGRITAEILAKVVVILGEVEGNIRATDKVVIRDNGSVEGNITAPRVAIAEGARFRGKIDMERTVSPKIEGEVTAEGRPQGQLKVQAKEEVSGPPTTVGRKNPGDRR